MSHIRELGDKILEFQASLGLSNPRHYNEGLHADKLEEYPLFLSLPAGSELHQLFAWKNGSVQGDIPMMHLWIIPGFFMLSSEESFQENRYCSSHMPGWSPTWFSLLTDGSAGRMYCDVSRVTADSLSVFYSQPEDSLAHIQIYDSITSMFRTVLECYEKHIYFLSSDGLLDTHFEHEKEVAKALNPNSSYWCK